MEEQKHSIIWYLDVEGEPKPQGSKNAYVKDGKAILVEASKGVHSWRTKITRAAAANPPKETFDCPVWVLLEFYLTQAPSNKKRFPSQKPDLDKLVRATLDAIVAAGVIKDDQLVTKLSVKKRWSNSRYLQQPGVYIVISEDLDE